MTLGQTLFGFEGRIGRITLWLSGLAVVLLDVAVLLVVSGWVRAEYLTGVPHRPGGAVVGAGLGLLAITALSVWIGLALMVKRCHDRGHSGWRLLLALTGVGAVWLLIDLGFLPGVDKGNPFGAAAGTLAEDDPATAHAERRLNFADPEPAPRPEPAPALAAALWPMFEPAAQDHPAAAAEIETHPHPEETQADAAEPLAELPEVAAANAMAQPEPDHPALVHAEPVQLEPAEPAPASEPEPVAALAPHTDPETHEPEVREPEIHAASEPVAEPEPSVEMAPAPAPVHAIPVHPVMALGGVLPPAAAPAPPPEPAPEPPPIPPHPVMLLGGVAPRPTPAWPLAPTPKRVAEPVGADGLPPGGEDH